MTKIENFESVYTASGNLDGEMMKNFLLAHGVESILLGESAGTTYGLTTTPLGKIEVMVKLEDIETAHKLIQQYENGFFED
ncbi:MAG TPA: hypothetical protein DCK95_02885 [Anaerolineaceae bacterium]|uniref:DUF2007 domain-containing protein n=1 Tax=Anaerolinea thermophila TaxID=167964 RepID=A0A101FYZ7_9CHLR|nr:MAG: hypothetical protein XD73_0243 [Anaerolinea thermophila]HAF61253.1 hypothetical protein [Anaerolineaceae bacterium]